MVSGQCTTPLWYHTWEVLSRTIFAVLDTQVGRPAADVHVELHQLAQQTSTTFEYTNLGVGYVLNFPIGEGPWLQISNNSTESWAGRQTKTDGVRISYRLVQRWKPECTS